MRIVGELQCQCDSFLKELDTNCVSCKPSGKKEGLYEVELEDTILFPEGGGQPNDRGMIADVEVVDVQRHELHAIHYTTAAIPVGPVRVRLDWTRRFDNMQHHTGQHLISAIAEKLLNWKTVSWTFNTDWCSVEMESELKGPPPVEDLKKLREELVNNIKKAIPISILDEEGYKRRDATLPDEEVSQKAVGSLRWVQIEGIDVNPCCGTHLTNTSQLDNVVISHRTEKIRGKNFRLFFKFGKRADNYLLSQLETSFELAKLLGSRPEDLVDSVTRIQAHYKDVTKQMLQFNKSLCNYVATDFADRIVAEKENGKVWLYNDVDFNDLAWVNNVSMAIQRLIKEHDKVWALVAVGGVPLSALNIIGSEELVKDLSAFICANSDAKGAYQQKIGKWQGKVIPKGAWIKQLQKSTLFTVENITINR